MLGQAKDLLSYIDEVCLMSSIRARISLTIDTSCGQGFGPSLDRYVEALISGTEGLAAGLATGFINLTQDPAILRMEQHALQSLSVPPYSVPCLSGCLFVILHVAFCIAKCGSEPLSDVRAVCYCLCLIESLEEPSLEPWAGRDLQVHSKALILQRRPPGFTQSVTRAGLESSSPDLCSFLLFP